MEKEEQPEQAVEDKEEEVLWFTCHICNLKEVYHEKVRKTKFSPYITFSSGSYIVKDPFTPAEKKQFFILGSDCCKCNNPVCQSTNCSIFYKRRYCQNCASKNKNVFPEPLHTKIKSLN